MLATRTSATGSPNLESFSNASAENKVASYYNLPTPFRQQRRRPKPKYTAAMIGDIEGRTRISNRVMVKIPHGEFPGCLHYSASAVLVLFLIPLLKHFNLPLSF